MTEQADFDRVFREGAIEGLIGRAEAQVAEIVETIGEIREVLGAHGIDLGHWQSYRLALILSRVDEAAGALIVDQARRAEAREQAELPGQLPAFPE
jgi:hypothetical protein